MDIKKKPYLTDGVIGNSSLLATLLNNGRMYRLWWPHIDFPQHIDEMRVGIFYPNIRKKVIWIDDEKMGWEYSQRYLKDTNILVSEADNLKLKLIVKTTDFAVNSEDILVRNYQFKNTAKKPTTFNFIYYSSMMISENQIYNAVMFNKAADALIHYRYKYAFALSSSRKCTGYNTGDNWEDVEEGILKDGYASITSKGALSYQITIVPNSTAELTFYLACAHSVPEAVEKLQNAKTKDVTYWMGITREYWESYLYQAKTISCKKSDIIEIYNRSLLAIKLLCDEKTGSIMAAPEVDENYSKCGGYNYCWGRDGAYIAMALEKAGLYSLARDFYLWTMKSQYADGSWQQRYYHDGSLAPSWSFQIDEAGSILWGVWQHYVQTQDYSFLEEIWDSVKKGADFLISFMDEETNLPLASTDLWEERKAEHTYSAAAVYGGLRGASYIAERLNYMNKSEIWLEISQKIKRAIDKTLWNKKLQCYCRGIKLEVQKEKYLAEKKAKNETYIKIDSKGYTKYYVMFDPIVDTSLLGLQIPFGVFEANSKRMCQTADVIESQLWVEKIGGLKRYEDDTYIGGNPWIITTLWLALFRIEQKEYEKARILLGWVVKHRTSLFLLPEQIDKKTGEAAWVIPLAWSHAMFILTIHGLNAAGEL